MIHIGTILHNFFQEKRIRRAALARLMAIRLESLIKYEKKESIQTARLQELCTHLKHNFFMDIALMLPPDYTTTQNPFQHKDQRIAQLEEELKTVKTERDILLKVMGK